MLGDFHLFIGNAQGTRHVGRVFSGWLPANSYSSRTRKSQRQVASETCRIAYECSSAFTAVVESFYQRQQYAGHPS
jgi:uncharacterized protein YfcZ (UPF0381/DUF406 family)